MLELPRKPRAVIRCVDDRYCYGEKRDSFPAGYDFTSIGASLTFVEDEDWRRSFFRQIRKLWAAGVAIDLIAIVDHFSCTAGRGCKGYGGCDSREHHEANLNAAAQLIHQESGFENVVIKLRLHDIDGNEIIKVGKLLPAACLV